MRISGKFQYPFLALLTISILPITFLFINCDKGNTLFKPVENDKTDVVADVLDNQKTPPQTGLFDNTTEIYFNGNNGTRISIPAQAFVDINGNPVTSNIKIELIEALTKRDLFSQNTPTIFNNEILISGGVIYLNATSNGTQLIAQKTIIITVPTDSIDYDMELFSSDSDSTGVDFNWNFPDSSWTIEYDTIFPYNYFLKIKNSLSWINIDKFYKSTKPRINYCIKPVQNISLDSSTLYMIINDQNSLLVFPSNDSSFYLNNIPTDMNVTLFGIASLNNKLVCGILNDTIRDVPYRELNFNYVGEAEFKSIVDSIFK